MKKRIIIVGNGFASLFFVQYFLALQFFPFFTGFFRRLYSRYDITLIGDGTFTYFPAIPEFITRKKNKKGVRVAIRPFLRRRNIRIVDGVVTDIRDGGRTVVASGETYKNDALWLHRSADDKPPFWNLFPRHSKRLIGVKNMFERLYLFYLRYL